MRMNSINPHTGLPHTERHLTAIRSKMPAATIKAPEPEFEHEG